MAGKGKLYGIGAGAGDPQLLTVRAAKILSHIDRVMSPAGRDGGMGIAFGIVKEYVNENAELIPLCFPMNRDEKLLKKCRKEAADRIIRELRNGYSAAFVTLGDPSIYSTYSYIRRQVIWEGFETETVPGITSFCAGAARANVSIAEGNEKTAIVPSGDDAKNIGELIDSFETVIIMKAYKSLHDITDILKKKNRIGDAVLIRRAGLDGEKIIYGEKISEVDGEDYLTTLIVHAGEPKE